MAQSPLKTIAQVIGLQAALNSKVSAYLSVTPPSNPQVGDLWFQMPDITPPTIGVLTASGGFGSLTLSWTAATDDVGVVLYEYSYGTAADFTGATVGTTTNLSVALTPGAGTYYCRIRARDAAVNWSSYSATRTAEVTGPLSAPVVSATAGSLKITDAWAAVSGAASYEMYYSTSATPPTSGTTPTVTGAVSPYAITGLTLGVVEHSWVRAVDSAGNKGFWSTDASATPFWLNDFAAGEAFDATRLGKVLAGAGSANVASNVLTINSPATADAAGVYFQAYPFDKTKQQRYTTKVRITSRGTGAPYPTFIGIYNGASAPPATINGTVNNATISRICPAPFNGTPKWQIDHMGSTGTPFAAYWKALSSAWATSVAEADLVTETDSTYYTAIIEHDANGVVFEIRDASGNAISNCRTSKVLWADLPAIANSWWVTVASDLYTDYWNNTLEVTYMKYEENIGTVS